MFIEWSFSLLLQLLYFCFRAAKKKTLKFLSSFREETKNNDDRLTKLPARLTIVSESGIMADRRCADLSRKDSSGNIIYLCLYHYYFTSLSILWLVMLLQNYLLSDILVLNNTQKWVYFRSIRKHMTGLCVCNFLLSVGWWDQYCQTCYLSVCSFLLSVSWWG